VTLKNKTDNPRVIHEFEGGPTHLFWQNPMFFGTEYKSDVMKPMVLHECRYHKVFVDQKITPTLEAVAWEKIELAVTCEECEECNEETCPKSIEEVGQKGSGMQLSETLEGWVIDLGKCTPWVIVRPLVKVFSEEMEKQLSANEHKGGWKTCSPGFLMDELKRNYERLRWAINRGGDKEEVTKRAANIANFAMMLAENEGKLNT